MILRNPPPARRIIMRTPIQAFLAAAVALFASSGPQQALAYDVTAALILTGLLWNGSGRGAMIDAEDRVLLNSNG